MSSLSYITASRNPATRLYGLSNARPIMRWLLALSTGALGALAMPPFGIWPILFITLTVAVWLIDISVDEAATRWKNAISAAACGWWLGFGYFLAGLWWLGSAFLVDADEFLWALPLGVIGLPMGLALFTAFGFGLAAAAWRRDCWRILWFAASLSLAEWLRANILTGFPWNEWGMAFGQGEVLAQIASLGGLHWLTLLVLFIHAAPATLADRGSLSQRLAMPIAAAIALLLIAGFGLWRIPAEPSPTQPGIRLRIMQPNIDEVKRLEPTFRSDVMARYRDLSSQIGPEGDKLADITHLIWPESAFPFLLDYTPAALDEIARLLPPGAVLITGAARAEAPLAGEQQYRYFNAIRAYDSDAALIATYDKVHLVPFGEYLPLDSLLRKLGIRQFVHTPGGFEAGKQREALRIPGLPPASALICYEAIFPDEAILNNGTGQPYHEGLLLNLTNDAWFGMTPGPYQHFSQSRLRAIEQGLPLVRAANTGISAVIDPYGRFVTLPLNLGETGIIDASLPQPLDDTFFTFLNGQAGAGLYWMSLICFAVAGIIMHRKAPQAHAKSLRK